MFGWPPGLGYFVDMFKNRVGDYVRRLISKTKPRKVIVCMIYYPDERAGDSWADGSLGALCYNSNPRKVQSLIAKVFELATNNMEIGGTEVVAFPLFGVLDGKDTNAYVQRVEPSPHGGHLMAAALMDEVLSTNSASPASDTGLLNN